ncbi:MerR family transcriptional regulator [Salinactinospora qingdaonensis]|uniref:MerR family transcriptional regulator n=1 Tax=Salinactinospora qingdaonensis TaxID=702744 RepID=A0ABP7FY20_9ACTN
MATAHMQIGEVAERTGLSLRTIRYYGEVGLVEPSARSRGGFRLYTDADVERLLLVKRMKPLDFSLEDMRDLLATLDRLAGHEAAPRERDELLSRLRMFEEATAARCSALREELAAAEAFGERLRSERITITTHVGKEKKPR